jgi:hypothetical protein
LLHSLCPFKNSRETVDGSRCMGGWINPRPVL